MTLNAKLKNQSRVVLPKSFPDLVRLMMPMTLRDDVAHANALEMIDRLMEVSRPSRGQTDYMETLLEHVQAYESKRHAIDVSGITGIESLRYIIEEAGMSASELARLLGVHATMGSKILKGERRLTWDHAKILGAHFKVAPAMLMD